jgi:hypothetical protein
VIDDVRQIPDEDTDETWERVTSHPPTQGVFAARTDFRGGWNVTVAVMEFVRQEPLEGELRRRIGAALRSADGVEMAGEMDREVWVRHRRSLGPCPDTGGGRGTGRPCGVLAIAAIQPQRLPNNAG